MWKDRGSADWCSTEWRGKREKTEEKNRNRKGEGGVGDRGREEYREIKSSGKGGRV